MPVKFWQMIVRFWFFLSYLITTVQTIEKKIVHLILKWNPTIVKALLLFGVASNHLTDYSNQRNYLGTVSLKPESFLCISL